MRNSEKTRDLHEIARASLNFFQSTDLIHTRVFEKMNGNTTLWAHEKVRMFFWKPPLADVLSLWANRSFS